MQKLVKFDHRYYTNNTGLEAPFVDSMLRVYSTSTLLVVSRTLA